MKSESIIQFLKRVTARLNLNRAARIAGWALFGAGVAMLVHAIYFRVQGELVPWTGAMLVLGAAGLVGFFLWLGNRPSLADAAHVADEKFDLKDGLVSALQFGEEGKEGEVYELQRKGVENKVENLKAEEIKVTYPGRWAAVGAGALAVALWMGFLPPSEAVQARMDREQMTSDRTEEIKKELEEMVEEIIEDLSDDEKEVLNPDELKEWVAELKQTKDQREAMKQLARFEQKLSKAMAGLETREEEETMKLAAAELSKSDMAAARQLGKKIEAKDFDLAAEDLKKATKKLTDQDIKKMTAEQKKMKAEDLKKLREMTKRMANAAKNRTPRQGKMRDAKGKLAKANGKDLKQLMEDADDAVEDFEDMLDDMEEMDGDMEEMEEGECEMCDKMGKLQGKMKRMGAKRKMKGKMKKLRAGLGKCQSFAMGKSQMLGLAQSMAEAKGAGGLKPGVGTDSTRRKERDKLTDNGNGTELKGQHGEGPSVTAVEEAESGTGISGRNVEAEKARQFQRKMEAFVRRDDVPEEVKMGVKEYFERVHEVEVKK